MSFSKRLLSGAAPALVPGENFKVVQYTGNGSSQSITGVGFQPDFVWHKRLNSSGDHNLSDSTRGVKKGLNINDPRVEGDQDPLGVTSFDSDGFTVNDNSGGGAGVNGSSDTYVAWCWKGGGGATSNSDGSITSTVNANKAAGFSIVKYTGTGGSGSVGHGLSSDPKLIVNKRISQSADWLAGAVTWTKYLEPNGTPPFRTANVWTDTQPTSTTFGVINSTSANSVEYINYCWADVEGYQKISTYEGNGSTNGPAVNVGFEPAYVMVKNLDSTDNWLVFDNARNTTNPRTNLIQWNLGAAQSTEAGAQMNFYSNGFQSVGTGGGGGSGQINNNGDTYLYLAIAANPDEEAPTLASSFNIETYRGTGASRSITGLGFDPGLLWIKRTTSSASHSLTDIVRGDDLVLQSNETSAEASGQINLDSDGFTIRNDNALRNTNNEDYVAWTWKANDNEPTYNTNGSINSIVSANDNAGFSIVSYTGDGNSARTVGHGLSAKCDLVIIKGRDSADKWPVQLPQLGDNARMVLEGTAGKTDDSTTAQAGNATVFGIGGDNAVNKSGDRFIAYCFRNITGYQKIGTYTGDGQTDQTITTGFKPDFIVIKSTIGNANWRIYDTRRTIDEGFIRAHTNGAEHTDSDTPNLEIISTGFKITSGGVSNGVNANGNVYFYWAIAKNVPSNTTLANSFKAITYSGTSATHNVTGAGFSPDLVWLKERNGTDSHQLYDTLRGANRVIYANGNNAQYAGAEFPSFDSDGFTLSNNSSNNESGKNYIAWCWKAGNNWESNIDGTQPSLVNANTANGFSIVKWKTNGSSSQTVGHGLSSTPQLVIYKRLDSSQDWFVETNIIDGSYDYGNLNSTDAFTTNETAAWSTRATSTTITNFTSSDNFEYVAYCWHSVSGYSKIGTFSGNSSTGHSITGLGFQPDFVMLKRTDNNCSNSAFWFMFDSQRGAQNYLRANGNNTENTGADATLTSFDSDGFTLGNDGCLNAGTVIYMAFKVN